MIIASWYQSILLPCPLKKITGLDCPLCGFQRSVIALLYGDFKTSLHLYPATMLIIVMAAVSLMEMKWRRENAPSFKKPLLILTAVVITGSYLFKMSAYL